MVYLYLSVITICASPSVLQLLSKLNTLLPPFVYEQNELRFVCPYFVQRLMLFLPSLFLSFSVTGGHSLIKQVATPLSLKMNCMHCDVTSMSFCRGAK